MDRRARLLQYALKLIKVKGRARVVDRRDEREAGGRIEVNDTDLRGVRHEAEGDVEPDREVHEHGDFVELELAGLEDLFAEEAAAEADGAPDHPPQCGLGQTRFLRTDLVSLKDGVPGVRLPRLDEADGQVVVIARVRQLDPWAVRLPIEREKT
ncbi:MAG: hypothetical protein AAF108_10445 [Planctomycetota bacterium]